jgi:hypothetical protein
MTLEIKEFSGNTGSKQIAMQPVISAPTSPLAVGGSYTIAGAGGAPSIVELFANGASHSFTVSGGVAPLRNQTIASGERLVYGFAKDAVITVTA